MKLLTSLILLSLAYVISAKIKDHYCGNYNCYTLLNVSKEATQPEIKKAYKAQSLKYHPDRNRDKDTTAIYREINRAYEVLNNEDLRKVYDEYLANPNANEYYQYYQFYKAVYAPQLDPRLVVGLVLSLVSIFQYFTRRYMFQHAISQIQRTTKFQTLVNQRFEEEKAAKSGIDKDDIIKELTETVRVHGGYSAPKIKDLLVCKTVLLPYSILKWIYDQIRWVVLFWILKRPYGEKEKEYLTRTRLGLNEARWAMQPEEQKEHFLSLELWVKENLVKYMKQMEEQRKEMMANSTKYKQYQRYLKNKKR